MKYSILSFSIVVLLSLANASSAEKLTDDIIQWVRSKGGFFNEKLEIRREDESDASSPFGVYARENITRHENLMMVPKECYIDVSEKANDINLTSWDLSFYVYRQNLCTLSKKLKQELSLGPERSKYGPYIKYLQSQRAGQLPAMWSKAGKDLLRKILPEGSDAVDWMDMYYKEQLGCIQGDNPEDEHILEMTVQRSFDTALIPIWDMVNHDNFDINTENDPMYDNGGIQVRASEDIPADEEVSICCFRLPT